MSPSRMMMIEMLKWSGDEVTMTRDSDTDSDKSLLSWWSDMCGTFSKECSSGKYDQIYWQNNLISNSLFVLEILISTSLNIKCYQISSEPRINTSVSTTLTSLYCQEFHHTSEPELSWYFDLIIVIGSKMMLITWTIFILSWKIDTWFSFRVSNEVIVTNVIVTTRAKFMIHATFMRPLCHCFIWIPNLLDLYGNLWTNGML